MEKCTLEFIVFSGEATYVADAAGGKIRSFRRKGERFNQDMILEKKTSEAMALSMYVVELLDNIKHHLFACKIE